MCRLWLLTLILVSPISLHATERTYYRFAEAAFSTLNPDTDELADTHGYTVKGEFAVSDHLHLSGRYTHGDEVNIPSALLKDWYSVGVGWNRDIQEDSSLYARITYDVTEGVQKNNNASFEDSGVGLHVGARTHLAER